MSENRLIAKKGFNSFGVFYFVHPVFTLNFMSWLMYIFYVYTYRSICVILVYIVSCNQGLIPSLAQLYSKALKVSLHRFFIHFVLVNSSNTCPVSQFWWKTCSGAPVSHCSSVVEEVGGAMNTNSLTDVSWWGFSDLIVYASFFFNLLMQAIEVGRHFQVQHAYASPNDLSYFTRNKRPLTLPGLGIWFPF